MWLMLIMHVILYNQLLHWYILILYFHVKKLQWVTYNQRFPVTVDDLLTISDSLLQWVTYNQYFPVNYKYFAANMD